MKYNLIRSEDMTLIIHSFVVENVGECSYLPTKLSCYPFTSKENVVGLRSPIMDDRNRLSK